MQQRAPGSDQRGVPSGQFKQLTNEEQTTSSLSESGPQGPESALPRRRRHQANEQ